MNISPKSDSKNLGTNKLGGPFKPSVGLSGVLGTTAGAESNQSLSGTHLLFDRPEQA